MQKNTNYSCLYGIFEMVGNAGAFLYYACGYVSVENSMASSQKTKI